MHFVGLFFSSIMKMHGPKNKKILLTFTAGTERPANKTRVNETFNKTGSLVWRNIETLSCNRCCSEKALSITYSECVFVDFVIQHVIAHASYCHLCPARLYNMFLHHLINGTIFEKNYWTNIFFLFSLQLLPETFLILRILSEI